MKVRKAKDIKKVLKQKGFALEPAKGHHEYYYLVINGVKQHVYTYFSHSLSEYNDHLMSQMKKQLKFTDSKSAEDFFDCPMSSGDYVSMLKQNGEV